MAWDPSYGTHPGRYSYYDYSGPVRWSRYGYPIGMSYYAFRAGLNWSSRMRYYSDYYKKTGYHHNPRYYTGYKYW